MTQPLHIKNAHIWDSDKGFVQRDLYTANERIVDRPANGAIEVDLDGYTIFPGLINAHDHLELNHYPRSKFRDVYDNAHQWGEDMNARLDTEPYKSLRACPLDDRLFIGGLKNLLCGATTVAHHNPPHKVLFRKDFPVRVLQKYGWAHSLHFNTDSEIIESYRKTPKAWPWFIHLAEGTDEVTAGEYQRLKTLGCVGENTVIIHGVGMTKADLEDAVKQVRGVVWCPSTYKHLLFQDELEERWLWTWIKPRLNTDFSRFWRHNQNNIALGSDSRLTADGDLLNELSHAAIVEMAFGTRHHKHFIRMVTDFAAKLLGMKNVGQLYSGAFADYIAIKTPSFEELEEELDDTSIRMDLLGSEDPFEAYLCHSRRADLALVVRDGIPRIGDPNMMAKFPHIQTVAATLDGVPKAIHIDLARRIHQCTLKEPGLEVDALPSRRFFLF